MTTYRTAAEDSLRESRACTHAPEALRLAVEAVALGLLALGGDGHETEGSEA